MEITTSLNGGFSPNCRAGFISYYHLDIFFGLCPRYFCKAGDTVHLRASACWFLVGFGIAVVVLVWVTQCSLFSVWKRVLLASTTTLSFQCCCIGGSTPFLPAWLLIAFGFRTSSLHFICQLSQTSNGTHPLIALTPLCSSYSSFFNNQLLWCSLHALAPRWLMKRYIKCIFVFYLF